MSSVTHGDKKIYSITGWWVVIACYGTEQMNTGWVESSDSPPDYSLQCLIDMRPAHCEVCIQCQTQ